MSTSPTQLDSETAILDEHRLLSRQYTYVLPILHVKKRRMIEDRQKVSVDAERREEEA
jgi:hypothetical protein